MTEGSFKMFNSLVATYRVLLYEKSCSCHLLVVQRLCIPQDVRINLRRYVCHITLKHSSRSFQSVGLRQFYTPNTKVNSGFQQISHWKRVTQNFLIVTSFDPTGFGRRIAVQYSWSRWKEMRTHLAAVGTFWQCRRTETTVLKTNFSFFYYNIT